MIIFSIGLPLLPNFINYIASDSTVISSLESFRGEFSKNKLREYGIIFAYGDIVDSSDKPIPRALLKAIVKGELVAAYTTNNNGRFIAGRPDRGLPKIKTKIYVEYVGFSFEVEPSEVGEEDYTYNPFGEATAEYYIKIRVPKILILDRYSFIVKENYTTINKVSMNSSHLEFLIESMGNTTIRLVLNIKYNVTEIKINDNIPSTITCRSCYWFNTLVSRIYYIPLPKGRNEVSIFFNKVNSEPQVKIKEIRYLDKMLGRGGNENSLTNIAEILGKIIFSWVFLPTMYLIMLSSVSYSLAYVIGGLKPRLPIKERW